ncbi:alpha/beta-hydrolase [Mycena crocata]|nr:alpha/beta-hydrolase [Mycena crocata]
MTPKLLGLPTGIQSRTLDINDLELHILEASAKSTNDAKPPLVILLHGFPELAYSWRKVMVPLSKGGYHVVAPDQRGYGRTKSAQTESKVEYEDDLTQFRMTNLVKDVVALVYSLGYSSVAAVVGHDFGSSVAAYCALIRPDLFRSVVLMSTPFTGPPKLSLGKTPGTPALKRIVEDLATLDPPRKHYWMYYSTPDANADMMNASGGLHNFLREYYHAKSADWKQNTPHALAAPTAASMAVLPHYYVMLQHETMPESVHGVGPSVQEITANAWLTEEELGVYVAEYTRTGFQGGLNSYRMRTDPVWSSEGDLFSGKKIDVPAMFMAGLQDWGTYQFPGAVDVMREQACTKMDPEFVLIEGAGHWMQQEQSEKVVEQLLRFLKKWV